MVSHQIPVSSGIEQLDPDVQDAFIRLLEGSDIGERTLFQSISPFGATPGLDLQFQGLFTPTFNRFLGALGSQIRSGNEPTLSFNEFLTEQFDPLRALLQLPSNRTDVAAGGTVFNF
jgi:hypothetical protein